MWAINIVKYNSVLSIICYYSTLSLKLRGTSLGLSLDQYSIIIKLQIMEIWSSRWNRTSFHLGIQDFSVTWCNTKVDDGPIIFEPNEEQFCEWNKQQNKAKGSIQSSNDQSTFCITINKLIKQQSVKMLCLFCS